MKYMGSSVMSTFLNSLFLDEIIISDQHSPKSIEKLHKVRLNNIHSLAYTTIKDNIRGGFVLIAPDESALARVVQIANHFEFGDGIIVPTVTFKKERDPTGKFPLKFTPPDNLSEIVKNEHCIMIDDICDGGGTFIGVKDQLMSAGATEVSIFVTHGLFTRPVLKITSRISGVTPYTLHPEHKLSIDPRVIK